MVPIKTRTVLAPNPLAYAQGYIKWFYQISYPYTTPDVTGTSYRPAHLEILEEGHIRRGAG